MAGLPEPALNAPIFDVDGSLVAIGDLVWWEQKVVVEYEGDQHRFGPGPVAARYRPVPAPPGRRLVCHPGQR